MRIAVVIPVLNEAESLPHLLHEIEEVRRDKDLDLEVVVVDDGSVDGSHLVAMEAGATVLRSTRNRGKSEALQAGFDATSGFDVIVTMDGDLQDDPTEIPRLLGALDEFDLVSGWKRTRRDTRSRRVQSRLFGSVLRRLTGVAIHDFNCGLKAYRRAVLDDLVIYGDLHRLIPVLVHEAGYDVGEIEVNHRPRRHGRSRYGPGRILRGPFDTVTVLFLARLGERPLHAFGLVGGLLTAAGMLMGGYLSWLRLIEGQSIGDRPLLQLAVLLTVVGVQFFGIGLVAEMILARSPRRGGRYRPLAKGRQPQMGSSDGEFNPRIRTGS